MKVLLEMKNGFAHSVEQYDLNRAGMGKGIGVTLLYTLYNKMSGQSITGMQEYTEITKKIPVRDKAGLLKEFESEKLEFWELRGKYDGVELIVHGQYNKTIVTVFYPKNSAVNVKKLFEDAEQEANKI